MLKNEEKIVSEKLILQKEKKQIKAAQRALDEAEKKLRTKPTKISTKPKKPKYEPNVANTMKSQSCFYILYNGHKGPNGETLAVEVAQ